MVTNSDKVMEYRKSVNIILVEYDRIKVQWKNEKDTLRKAGYYLINCRKAQSIIQRVAQSVQETVHNQIASLVSKCLQDVFIDDPYTFRIIFERKRSRTDARLTFWRNGHEVSPKNASGGGVVDIAALALRIVCIMMARPNVRRLVILDEPFRFVSPHYQPLVVEMLHRLAEEMEIQFVMVTNVPGLATGQIIHIKKRITNNGGT